MEHYPLRKEINMWNCKILSSVYGIYGNKILYWPVSFNSKMKQSLSLYGVFATPFSILKITTLYSWEDSFLLSYRESLGQCDIPKAIDRAENKSQWVTVYFQSVLMWSQASLTIIRTACTENRRAVSQTWQIIHLQVSPGERKAKDIWIQCSLVFVWKIKWRLIEKLNRAHLFIKCPLLKCILSNF